MNREPLTPEILASEVPVVDARRTPHANFLALPYPGGAITSPPVPDALGDNERVPLATGSSPVFWIIAGSNGAGKTTLVNGGRIRDVLGEMPLLNPDELALAIRRQRPHVVPDEANLQAARLTEQAVDAALAARKSVLVETVLASDKYLSRAARAHATGYTVGMVYVALSSPQLALYRVRQRVAAGGHDVPADRVRARWLRSHSNLAMFVRHLDVVLVLNNSSADGNHLSLEAASIRGDIALRQPVRLPEVERALLSACAFGDRRPGADRDALNAASEMLANYLIAHARRAVRSSVDDHFTHGRIIYGSDRGRIVALARFLADFDGPIRLHGWHSGMRKVALTRMFRANGIPLRAAVQLTGALLEGCEIYAPLRGGAKAMETLRDFGVRDVRGGDSTLMHAPRLDEWRTIIVDDRHHLVGRVWGHPRLRDGARCITSAVLSISQDRTAASTQSRLYELGTPGEGELPADWGAAVNRYLATMRKTRRNTPT